VTKNSKVRVGNGYRVGTRREPILLANVGGQQRHKAFPSIFDGLAASIPASPTSSIGERVMNDASNVAHFAK
jgi:hypothetical protein